eukprot:6206957-Pleurochrysis_carterae.AAC.3
MIEQRCFVVPEELQLGGGSSGRPHDNPNMSINTCCITTSRAKHAQTRWVGDAHKVQWRPYACRKYMHPTHVDLIGRRREMRSNLDDFAVTDLDVGRQQAIFCDEKPTSKEELCHRLSTGPSTMVETVGQVTVRASGGGVGDGDGGADSAPTRCRVRRRDSGFVAFCSLEAEVHDSGFFSCALSIKRLKLSWLTGVQRFGILQSSTNLAETWHAACHVNVNRPARQI